MKNISKRETVATSGTIELADYGYNIALALNSNFPHAKAGDIIVVTGAFGKGTRHLSLVDTNGVLAAVNNAYCELGKRAVVDVFIRPEGAFTPAPYAKGTFFNVSAAPDCIGTGIQSGYHMPLRRYDATKLVEALQLRPDYDAQGAELEQLTC